MQYLSNIKAIVFDWDEVIVDSMPAIARGIQETAASYDIQISIDEILSTYFQPKEAFYKSIGVDTSDITELFERHNDGDNKYVFNERLPLFNDVVPTLFRLAEKQFRLGIVTGRKQANIQSEVAEHEFQQYFPSEHILGGEDLKEDNIATLIRRFEIAPHELLFVGDLPSDITAPKKVGAKSAGISRHESGKARLKAENPDYFLDSLLDLLKI